MTLQKSVELFIENIWQGERKKSLLEKIAQFTPRYNAELHELAGRVYDNRDQVTEVYDQIDKNDNSDSEAISIAKEINPSYKTGLAIGYIFPDEEFKISDNTFDSGLRKGQVYGLKILGNRERKKTSGGMMLMTGGLIAHSFGSPYAFTQENLAFIEKSSQGTSGFSTLALGYGLAVMIHSRLFSNDAHLSNQLKTSGPFAMHRNPFYSGILATGLAATSFFTAYHLLAENPNWIAPGLIAAGLGMFAHGLHSYTKNDERVLEKQFGAEYVDYKKKTPRYIPNPLNLFRRRK